MIMVGLKTNFFVDNEVLIGSEKRFKYKNENPKYLLYATMDKVNETDKNIIIYDWKSSKKKYEGEDKESNLQSLIYSLISTKIWPNKQPIIRFVFLQYPEDPIIELSYDLATLKGFEYYLAQQQEKIEKFTLKDAESNFAADKEIPKTGEFKGRLSCGFSKYKGQLKKDGNLMWACPFKWDFNYYKIKENNKLLYCVLEEDLSKTQLKDGQIVEKMTYKGCPRYNNLKPEINILDNF
jgi:hypothetical protein